MKIILHTNNNRRLTDKMKYWNRQFLGKVMTVAAVLGFVVSHGAQAQKVAEGITQEVTLFLTNITEDRVKVELKTPPMEQDVVHFLFPRIVPGTYAMYDFGRFISDFRAYDYDGQRLRVDSISVSERRIHNALALHKITYLVDDTFDAYSDNIIFEPAGTSIQADTHFLINLHGFVGYFEEFQNIPYQLRVVKPSHLYGVTSMDTLSKTDSIDLYSANNYASLIDQPLMYNSPDTTSWWLGNTHVQISVFSPAKQLTARELKVSFEQLLSAAKEYLGESISVNKYSFLIYLSETMMPSGKFGALEHANSSVYVLPEYNALFLNQLLGNIVLHEFMHILTPLTFRSEKIANFDFQLPDMSKHLWLYEGAVEYFSAHLQVQQGLVNTDAILKWIRTKMQEADKFDCCLSFTTLSRKVLAKHADQYANVYQRGALLAMALDIVLMSQTDGKSSLISLLQDLVQTYDSEKPFPEGALFQIFGEKTNASVVTFLEKYIAGESVIPYDSLLALVGVAYIAPQPKTEITLGNVNLSVDQERQLFFVENTTGLNEFGKELGYQKGDLIISFQRKKVNTDNYLEIFEEFKQNTQPSKKVKVKVQREVSGKYKRITLQAKAMETKIETKRSLNWLPQLSPQQQKLKARWIEKISPKGQ